MKDIIRKFPPLIFLIRFFRTGFFTGYELMSRLPHCVPLSEGPQRFRAKITLLAAEQTVPLLGGIAAAVSERVPPTIPVGEFSNSPQSIRAASALAELFKKYGSDKSTSHDYELLYGALLADAGDKPLKVLEIGLGTNNTKVLSNMGADGRPGASLRAFRDFLPNASVYGADIDRGVLFEEERIRTFFIDQVRPKSFDGILDGSGESQFDLIIDDGLHVANANLTTMGFAIKHLSHSGWFVVEDISEAAVVVWQVAAALVAPAYTTYIIKARGGYMFAMTRAENAVDGGVHSL